MTDLLSFANIRPADVAPVYPTYQRPSMNIAPVIETADKLALAKAQLNDANLTNDYNARTQEDRINLLKIQADNAKTQQPEIAAQTQAAVRASQDALSESDRQRNFGKALGVGDVTEYVLQKKGDPAAIEEGRKQLVQMGVLDPAAADAWAKDVQDPKQAQHYLTTRDAFKNYMVSRGGGSYSMTPKELADLQTTAYRQAENEAAVTANAAGGSPVDPAAVDKRAQEIFTQMRAALAGGGGGAPPGTPAPPAGSATDDKAKADSLLSKAPGAPAAAPDGKVATGSVVEKSPGQTKGKVTAAGAGTEADPVQFTGDATDDTAIVDWWNGLQMGAWVLDPKTGRKLQKHSNIGAAGEGG